MARSRVANRDQGMPAVAAADGRDSAAVSSPLASTATSQDAVTDEVMPCSQLRLQGRVDTPFQRP